MSDVRISVIITAHNRRVFLEDALRSVLQQTLKRETFEIIVVKNFYDENLDNLIDANHVTSIFSDTEFLGKDKTIAAEASSGDILCFLDDDDLFLPEKLKTVLRFFDSNPDLAFYRNNPIFFDEGGERGNLIRGASRVHDFTNPEYAEIRTLVEDRAAFNSSCISIRKSLILGKLEEFAKIKIVVDYCLFIFACNSGKRIIQDTALLTKYRVSGKLSISRPLGDFNEFRSKTLRLKNDELKDLKLICDMKNKPDVAKIIGCEVVYQRLHTSLFTEHFSKKQMLLDCLRYVRCVLSMPSKYKPFFVAYALGSLLDGNFIQRIIYKSMLDF